MLQFSFKSVLVLCVFAVAVSEGCRGVSPAFDQWCVAQCNHPGSSVCPDSLCVDCAASTEGRNCTSVRDDIDDSFCNLVCNFDPPFCPAGLCSCDANEPLPASILNINMTEHTCCPGDTRYVFYGESGVIYRTPVGGSPQVCYTIPGIAPRGIELDSDSNMYVADPLSGILYRMSANCDENSIEVITSWNEDNMIPNPTGVAIVSGLGLLVSSPIGIYQVTLYNDGSVHEVKALPGLFYEIVDIEVVGDTVYFINRNAEVVTLDINSGAITSTYLAIHQFNIPDYGGIAINECGLYFSATDSNQVYFCPDLQDSTSCRLYCNPDPSVDNFSCVNMVNPKEIEIGCCCDIYVSSAGNGNLLVFQNDPTTDGNGPFDAEIFDSGLTDHNSIAFWIPPGSPSDCGGQARLCEGEFSPSASPSPSPTSAPTDSPSASPSASASASASPSPSPSVSVTPESKRDSRIVFGFKLQAAGGTTTSAATLGFVTFSLIVCPEGIAAESPLCFDAGNNGYNIPLTLLDFISQDGNTIEPGIPMLQVGSHSTDPGFTEMCAFHEALLIRRGSTISVCDAACIAAREGTVNLNTCATQQVLSVDAEARARAAMTARAAEFGSTLNIDTTVLPASSFQTPTQSMCDGDVILELSVSQFAQAFQSSSFINIFAQPRFAADRCTSPSIAPRVCYDSDRFSGLTGELGNAEGYICAQFFTLDDTVDTGDFNVVDPTLPAIEGDFIDTVFFARTNAQGCPTNIAADAQAANLCNADANRLCFVDECP